MFDTALIKENFRRKLKHFCQHHNTLNSDLIPMGLQDKVFDIRPANIRRHYFKHFPCILLLSGQEVMPSCTEKIGNLSDHHGLAWFSWFSLNLYHWKLEVVDLLWFEVPDLSVEFIFRQNTCKWGVVLPCSSIFIRRKYVMFLFPLC